MLVSRKLFHMNAFFEITEHVTFVYVVQVCAVFFQSWKVYGSDDLLLFPACATEIIFLQREVYLSFYWLFDCGPVERPFLDAWQGTRYRLPSSLRSQQKQPSQCSLQIPEGSERHRQTTL